MGARGTNTREVNDSIISIILHPVEDYPFLDAVGESMNIMSTLKPIRYWSIIVNPKRSTHFGRGGGVETFSNTKKK